MNNIDSNEDDANTIAAFKKLNRSCTRATMEYFPSKLTAEEFFDALIDAKDGFILNMVRLDIEENWAEDWMVKLASWMEMEKGNFE